MKRQILSVLLLSMLSISLNGQVPLINAIKDKLEIYNRILPYEKVYVKCDRPFYKPGEDIWLALWITGSDNKASEVSEIVTIELINPKGTIEQMHRVLATKGRASCDFNIDTSAMGGIYKIKAYTNWTKNFGEENAFIKEIQVQQISLPRLRMKLDIDRKSYGPNDTVKAKLVLQTLGNQPLSGYGFNYIVNLNGEEFLKSKAETNFDGKAEISFMLPPKLLSNDGLLNVTINFKGNPESISRSIPINMSQIDLQFFPEGGDLVNGSMNNCAFKAVNEYGKPADITGTIFNSKHKIITTFRSYHHGMGAFRFIPQAGEKYYALIDRPEGVLQLYPLPQALDIGYIMEIPQPMQFLKADSSDAIIRIVSPVATHVLLLAQMQGNIVFSSYFNCQKGENSFPVPLSAFKTGVAQITIFTKDNVEICERLVFVKKYQQLKVSITTDKTLYLPREKVKLNIHTSDASGNPLPAQLGLTVADDKLVSMADDKSDNIISHLLLSSDLKGKIEEPSFYFNPGESKADSALDYLLLTQGWRRFTWEEIVETPAAEWIKNCEYSAEKKILFCTITSSDKMEIQKTRLYIKETNQTAQVNENGYYEFRDLDLTTPLTLVAISGNNDTIFTTIKEYTSVNSLKQYYYNNWNKSLKGVVRDKQTGDPLIGANILIKGTTIGTVTDLDGRFNLNYYESAPLIISYMGYKSAEILANPSKTYNIELEKDIIPLDEIVVVGYGIQRRRSILGSVVSVQHTRNPIKVETKQDNSPRGQGKKSLHPKLEKTEIPQNRSEGTSIQIPAKGETIEDMIIEEDQPVFCIVEIPASFQGGDLNSFQPWIARNIRYPQDALENNIEGKVYVKFFVDNQGYVQSPEILRSLYPSCDQEALRIIRSSPRWSPARQMGRVVNSYFVIAVNFRMAELSTGFPEEEKVAANNNRQTQYYRSRKFYEPLYFPEDDVEVRTDFRKTIYWNPLINTDNTGNAQIEFFTSDELTTFRATVEGIDLKGNIGRNEYTFHTSKPVSVDARIPETVNFEDTLFIPVTIKNTSPSNVSGVLHVEYPSALLPLEALQKEINIPANDVFSTYIGFAVMCKRDNGNMKLVFQADSFKDVIFAPIKVETYGFPEWISLSGNKLSNALQVLLPSMIENSLQARLTVYPNFESSLTSSVASMLREPHGCFEQASATTYPNILALQYLRDTKQNNKLLEENALGYIRNGYKLLQSYETPAKGFEWFGKSPAHEGLTAFGLMEFNDMKKVCDVVDQDMYNRTLYWLLSRKDGNGGFKTEAGKYGFSQNGYLLNNAYLVYALSEIGCQDIRREFDQAYKDNIKRNDAYCMALLANSALNMSDTVKANALTDALTLQVKKNGINNLKSETSITGSSGKSLTVETVSLFSLALMKYQKPDEDLLSLCIRYILDGREFGSFGSSQASILALKALSKYYQKHQDLFNGGKVIVKVNDLRSGSEEYHKQQNESLVMHGLEKGLRPGFNSVDVNFEETLVPARFNLDIQFTSRTPSEDLKSIVRIETIFKQTQVKRGETLRLTSTIKNTSDKSLSMVIAAIYLPAGFSFQTWQLKELQDKNVFDYYEIKDNLLYIYYRTLEPNAIHLVNLDVVAGIPGVYHSMFSSCYLYYTPELRSYGKPVVLEIKK